MKKTFGILFVLGIWILVSCAPSQAAQTLPTPGFNLVTVDPNSTSTATPFQPVLPADTSTLSPTQTMTIAPTEAVTATSLPPTGTPLPATIAPSPTSSPVNTRTQYTFYASLRYSAHTVHTDETIKYTNTTGQSLSNIVLAVEPNLWSKCFYLNSITQDGQAVSNFTLNGQRMTITLHQPLNPNAITAFALSFDLALPAKSGEDPFGYLSNQINLNNWYPFIVPFENGWILHDPKSFGEHLVYDAADFDVNLKVDDPSVIIAASAPQQTNGDWMEYRLEAARTFTLSASNQFKVDDTAVGPAKIRSYYFAGDENAGGEILWIATQSLGLYDVKFAPYPYQSISIVETDVPDGQEFDGLVFLAKDFYKEYNGTAKSDLAMIGAHEIAHQWWFGLVGSDQAEEPWLDEAMAVYSEKIFYEYNYPNYGNWWWDFRVNYFGPSGYVDGSIYDYPTFRSYINAVYLNGANFLDDLRVRVGDDVFWAFLKDYASRYAHQQVTAADFFATLRLHTQTDFSDIIQKYFQQSH
jgi:hypothetical protein